MDNAITHILDRIRTWTPERQGDVAEIVRLIEEHDTNPLRLTTTHIAEVERRRANAHKETLTLAQLDARLRLLGI